MEEGETLALVGTNGAGKSTTVGAIAGSVRSEGRIAFRGNDISRLRQYQRARLGIRHVPENRGLFWNMTVAKNLELGARGRDGDVRLDKVLDTFPALRHRPRLRPPIVWWGTTDARDCPCSCL